MEPTKVKPRAVPLARKVEVGTYQFVVRVVPQGDPRLDGAMGIMLANSNDDNVFAILVARGQSPKQLLDTVLHEVTHAINFACDIDDGVDEETIALKHGAAWAHFWIDNPSMLRWLNYTTSRILSERK